MISPVMNHHVSGMIDDVSDIVDDVPDIIDALRKGNGDSGSVCDHAPDMPDDVLNGRGLGLPHGR